MLLDEIEKAHPDVFNLLLQVLDDGRITDGQGRTVDFRNTVVIMTSNLGTTARLQSGIGFNSSHDEKAQDSARALRDFFRPEFLNRVDEVVVFDPLAEDELLQIVDLIADEERTRLADIGRSFELTDAARRQLARDGYDPAFGARPLRRVFQRRIENPLSKLLIAGDFAEGQTIQVDYQDDYTFTTATQPASEPIAAAT